MEADDPMWQPLQGAAKRRRRTNTSNNAFLLFSVLSYIEEVSVDSFYNHFGHAVLVSVEDTKWFRLYLVLPKPKL